MSIIRLATDDPDTNSRLRQREDRIVCREADVAELPLPDQLHPDAATHRRIGARFGELAFGAGGPFAAERGHWTAMVRR